MKKFLFFLFCASLLATACNKKVNEDKNTAEASDTNTAKKTSKDQSMFPGGESVRKSGALEWVYCKPAGIEFAKTETTVAQYRACVKAGKCSKPDSKSDNEYCNWGYSDRDEHPVNCVDWNQAKSFCQWARGRLPTEDEWYAEASNKGRRMYPWGDERVSCDYAIWGNRNEADGCGRDSTWPVCSKTRGNSVSGLCDMSGNVYEWTSSLWDNKHNWRVVRGGSWNYYYSSYLRAAYRFWNLPSFKYFNLGIRSR